MSLIVAGSTGAIGREVVVAAVNNPRCSRIVALTRQGLGSDAADEAWTKLFGESLNVSQARSKVQVQTFDWEQFTTFWETKSASLISGSAEAAAATPEWEKYKSIFSGHQYAAMCLGSTRADAGSSSNFWRIDVEYPRAFASAVNHFSSSEPGNTLACYSHVSAYNSNPKSWFLYMKAKGVSDEDAIAQKFPRTTLIRPGFLNRKEKMRGKEKFAAFFMKGISVQLCGEAIVADLMARDPSTSVGKLLETSKKDSKEDKGAPVHVFYDAQIKKQAELLSSTH